MGVIRLTGVSKAFDGKPVVRGLSCEFAQGSVTLISGASGSGKTTLINLILGLVKADDGVIEVATELRKGVVFQEDRLLERMSAGGNVRFVCDQADDAIEGHLRRVGIDDCWGKRVGSFSGGMKRRVAIVRAVMVKPELLVLDEPFNGLDEESRAKAARYIMEERGGATVIVVTHDPEEARLLSVERIVEI